MTHLFGVLNVGTNALLLQQRALNVTSNNIANVNTPGYSRQRLIMATNTPVMTSDGPMGTGAHSKGVERIYDRYLGVQLNSESTNLGRWEAQQGMLERVEVIFDESGGFGLNQALSGFWNAWQDLGLNPSGQTERATVVAASQNLADTIRQKYADLEQAREDIDAAVESAVHDVNRLLAEIFDLNMKIVSTESSGVSANDFRDSRDLALKELSELISISSFEDAEGRVMVSTGGGHTLVEAGTTWNLATRTGADGHTEILWQVPNAAPTDISGEITGGRIGGWLQARDSKITGYQDDLDALANTLRTRVNALHTGGYDLNRNRGLNLFTGSAGAADLEINTAILDDSDLIAASSTAAGVPGNADNALNINALRATPTMGGSATFDDAANALVSAVGQDVRLAKVNATHQADMVSYLENYRDSVSGVSLDEEMVSLVKFQATYNAVAKMISMVDDMMDTLMNIVR